MELSREDVFQPGLCSRAAQSPRSKPPCSSLLTLNCPIPIDPKLPPWLEKICSILDLTLCSHICLHCRGVHIDVFTTGGAVLFICQSPLLLEVVGARQVQVQVQVQEEVGYSEGSGRVVRAVVPSRIKKLRSTWDQVITEDVLCSSSRCLLRGWLMHWSPYRMLLLLYASLEYRWRSRFSYNSLNSCLCQKQFGDVLVLEWNSQKLVSLVSL